MEPAARAVWRCGAAGWLARRSGGGCGALSPPLAAAPPATLRPLSGGAALNPCNRAVSPLSGLCRPWGAVCRRALCAGAAPCWGCRAAVSSSALFCPACGSILPPDDSKDFFQLLECERSFDMDVQDLQRKYRDLQRLLHPDYFSRKSQRERDFSEKQSSLVNKAYNTLLSPLSRGLYLLSLHGITIAEGTEGGVDAPFLLEVLEINEKLNDLSTEAEIEEIGTFVQDKCLSLTEHIRQSFEKGDLDGAKMLLAKMKYYSNILDQVKKKMLP